MQNRIGIVTFLAALPGRCRVIVGATRAATSLTKVVPSGTSARYPGSASGAVMSARSPGTPASFTSTGSLPTGGAQAVAEYDDGRALNPVGEVQPGSADVSLGVEADVAAGDWRGHRILPCVAPAPRVVPARRTSSKTPGW